MIFLKAFFLALVVIFILSVIVYIHIVIVLSIYNLVRYKAVEKKNPFLYGWKYKGKSVLKLFFSIFIFFHFLLFIDYYRSYINDKTKYHDAKVYYIVGMIPHTYSVFLGRFVTPLNPLFFSITKPTDAMKEYLFEKGSKLIPNTDAERELWEYEWFFYPYVIRFSDMYDRYYTKRLYPTAEISKETYHYLYDRLKRLYEIIEVLNTKKIADLYREADSIKKMPLMAYYYREKAQWLSQPTPIDIISKAEKIKIWKDFHQLEVNIKKWLQALPDRIDYQIQFQEWGNANLKALLKVEATRQFILLQLMQAELYIEIHAGKFNCNNKTTQAYINLRNRFIMGGTNSILNRLANYGGEKEAFKMQSDFKDDSNSDFFRLILKKYCSIDVLGSSKYTSKFYEKNVLDPDRKIIKILEKGKVK